MFKMEKGQLNLLMIEPTQNFRAQYLNSNHDLQTHKSSCSIVGTASFVYVCYDKLMIEIQRQMSKPDYQQYQQQYSGEEHAQLREQETTSTPKFTNYFASTISSTHFGTTGFFSNSPLHLPSHPSAVAGIANTALRNHVVDPAFRSIYSVGSSVLASIKLLFASASQTPPFRSIRELISKTADAPAREATQAPEPLSLVPSFGDSAVNAVSNLPFLAFVPRIANPPSALCKSRPVVILCTRRCQLGAPSVGGSSQDVTSTSAQGCMTE